MAIFAWALPTLSCYRSNHSRRLDQMYLKEAIQFLDIRSLAIYIFAKTALYSNLAHDDFDKATLEHIQTKMNHEFCTLADDVKHFNMIILSIKNLHKRASKGNLKSFRLHHYFENLYRGLADVLAHSDLEACENKA